MGNINLNISDPNVIYKRNQFNKKFTSAYEALKSMRLSLNLYAKETDSEIKTVISMSISHGAELVDIVNRFEQYFSKL